MLVADQWKRGSHYRPMRSRWARSLAGVLSIAIVVAVVLGIRSFVDATPTRARVTLPASVAAVSHSWNLPIELPASLPKCLTYASSGAEIVSSTEATGGRELRIALAVADTATCRDSMATTDIQLIEASEIESLSGPVTTATDNRLEFARLAAPASGGRTRLILQWHCEDQMCRVSGLVGPATLSESSLLQMAGSFTQAQAGS